MTENGSRKGPNHFSPELRGFWLTILILFVIGFSLIFIPVPADGFWKKLAEVANKLGEAVIIAAFLAGTVDFFLKDRLIREINFDVFKAVLGHGVSEKLHQEFLKIIETKMYRQSLELEIRFQEWEADDDKIVYRVESRYKMINLTEEPQLYSYPVSVEISSELEQRNDQKYCQLQRVGAENITLTSGGNIASINKHCKKEWPLGKVNGSYREWQENIYIPPSSQLPPGAHNLPSFWSETVQLFPKKHRIENITLRYPVIGIKVRVIEGGEDFDVNVTSGYPNKIKRNQRDEFISDEAFLPMQCLKIEWSEKTESTSQTVN